MEQIMACGPSTNHESSIHDSKPGGQVGGKVPQITCMQALQIIKRQLYYAHKSQIDTMFTIHYSTCKLAFRQPLTRFVISMTTYTTYQAGCSMSKLYMYVFHPHKVSYILQAQFAEDTYKLVTCTQMFVVTSTLKW